jgi:broad specificity phosphatase PhoE
MQVLMIRHGRPETQNGASDPDLCDAGRKQARDLGAFNRAIGDTATTFFAAETNFRLDRIIAAARSVPANDYFKACLENGSRNR